VNATDCVREAVGLLHGLSFLAGVVCGFALGLGLFVSRKVRVINQELEETKKRIEKGARR